jgi:hypothetical protein
MMRIVPPVTKPVVSDPGPHASGNAPKQPPPRATPTKDANPQEPLPGAAPTKDANPPDAQTDGAPEEVPKVGSRDAPGG